MKSLWSGTLVAGLLLGTLVGCSNNQQKSPDVADSICKSLGDAGLKDVHVSQDRDKGVVTLTGTAASEDQKSQAESIAKSAAGSQVVADEITVQPQGDSTAKDVNSDLDKGIEKDFHATLVNHKLNRVVNYHVKNGVVTLTGSVRSEAQRGQVEKLASAVPNVKQVVNELDVKGHKATSSGR
jgi:hyperosmotically inducible protein